MTPIRKRMLKAIKGKFTAREANARIEGFLKSGGCPWKKDSFWKNCNDYGGAICEAMFPKSGAEKPCPCHAYECAYIEKRANEALSEWH